MQITNELLYKKTYNNPLYAVYASMKKRCYTPSSTGYQNYGGKGVTVCDEWKNDFNSFVKWSIENGYFYETENKKRGERMSIDRISPNGNYEPSNCRWITFSENSRRASVGRKRTLEEKIKISQVHKGVKLTKEHKKKLSESHKGKNLNNKNARKGFYKMYDLDNKLIKSFNSPKEIIEYFLEKNKKVAIGTINATAHHKQGRTQAYGYRWEYKLCK